MRSPSSSASSTSWVTKTTVRRVRAQHLDQQLAACAARVWASSAPNGSSMRTAPGSPARPRASWTRWRMPPESWRGSRSAQPARPTRSSQARPRRGARRGRHPAAASGSSTLRARRCARAAGRRPGRPGRGRRRAAATVAVRGDLAGDGAAARRARAAAWTCRSRRARGRRGSRRARRRGRARRGRTRRRSRGEPQADASGAAVTERAVVMGTFLLPRTAEPAGERGGRAISTQPGGEPAERRRW